MNRRDAMRAAGAVAVAGLAGLAGLACLAPAAVPPGVYVRERGRWVPLRRSHFTYPPGTELRLVRADGSEEFAERTGAPLHPGCVQAGPVWGSRG
jgi:hypothetical protein